MNAPARPGVTAVDVSTCQRRHLTRKLGAEYYTVQARDLATDLYTTEQCGQVSTRARVRWVNKAGGLSLKQPLTGEKAQAFAASMRAAVRAFDAASGKRVNASLSPKPAVSPSLRAPEPPPLTDSDMPF